MKCFYRFQPGRGLFVSALLFLLSSSAQAQSPPNRQSAEDVHDAALRVRPGLQPNTNLLFNGWGITPAGSILPISDLALKLVIAPDKKTAVAVSAGYRNTGLTLIDLPTRQMKQFVPITEAWNGIAFSRNGKRLFVSGGDSGLIHAFSYVNGIA